MSDMGNTRLEKNEKRRKNNNFIKYFAVIASVLVLFLILLWIFGGDNDSTEEDQSGEANQDDGFFLDVEEDEENEQATDAEEASDNTNEEESNDDGTAEETDDASEDESEQNNEYADVIVVEEESTDPNVSEVYTGNWPPIGTEQTGPHTTVYNESSQDWIEIKRAVSYVTGLPEEEMIVRWIGNGGDQKVIATVSNPELTDHFRVYLSWVDNEGWQPTKMEVLVSVD